MEGTFHRRELKPPSVSFSSIEGKEIFKLALNEGNLEGYFQLAEHYITQGHPAFCGVGSLTMALNSLLLDPRRVWQGVWRWFDESMLDCCEPLDIIKMKGITLPKLSCLARCNGANSTLKYGNEITLEEFRVDISLISTSPPVLKTCPHQTNTNNTTTNTNTTTQVNSNDSTTKDCCIQTINTTDTNNTNIYTRNVMIASYCRGDLGQTGTGHFSPIGGYCAEKDMVLIMDVARFKYPPHWVPLTLLYHAMQRVDEETGKCRGYLLLSGNLEMLHKCECSVLCSNVERSTGGGVSIGGDSTSVSSNDSSNGVLSMSITNSTDCVVYMSTSSDNVDGSVDGVSGSVLSNVGICGVGSSVSAGARGVGSNSVVDNTSPATRLHTLLEHTCTNCK